MTCRVYEVTFKGVASDVLRAAFDGCELRTGQRTTTLRCPDHDLRALIARIQDFGLELVDVTSDGEPPSPR